MNKTKLYSSNTHILILQMENTAEDHGIVEEQLNDDDLEQMVMARVSKMANINEKVNVEQFVYCT
jgi:hypothetical protein